MTSVDTGARVIRADHYEYRYSGPDFINADACEKGGRAWAFHDAGYILAIVFSEYPAYCFQDALDTAIDADKLDRFQVTQEELTDYETGTDSEGYPEYHSIAFLGNASEPFNIESLDCLELPAEIFLSDPTVKAALYALTIRYTTTHTAYDAVEQGAAL